MEKQPNSFGAIYLVTNTVTKKCYVGQTIQKPPIARRERHKREVRAMAPRLALHRSLVKHGEAAFEFSVLEWCCDRASLDATEIKWIAKLNTLLPNGYNNAIGGGGSSGYKMTKEQIAKKSAKAKWRPRSPETVAKFRIANTGRKKTAEQKAKIAKSMYAIRPSTKKYGRLANCEDDESRARALAMREQGGLCRPVKANGIDFDSISDAANAIGLAPSAINRKIQQGIPGFECAVPIRPRKKRTPEQRAAMRTRGTKRVIAGGIEFASITLAAERFGMSRRGIGQRIAVGTPGYRFIDGQISNLYEGRPVSDGGDCPRQD